MPNILIAEDNPIQRNNLIKMLKDIIIKDINIYEAEDEASALKIANTEMRPLKKQCFFSSLHFL